MAKCWYHLQGVITGCIFLVLTIIMIPFTLVNDKMDVNISDPALMEKYDDTQDLLPPLVSLFRQLLQLGMALLSICCMILLGFADDVLGKLRQSDTLRLKVIPKSISNMKFFFWNLQIWDGDISYFYQQLLHCQFLLCIILPQIGQKLLFLYIFGNGLAIL